MQHKKLKATAPWMLIVRDVRMLEHDAQTQYRFNRFWALFWGSQMFMLPLLIRFFHHTWIQIEFFYVTEASLWANFATHFSGMSSALAAKNTTRALTDTAGVVQDVGEDINDIHDTTARLEEWLPERGQV